MSIQSEINRIKGNVAGAYSAVEEKGGVIPETQSSDKLAAAIESIPIGVTEEDLQNALSTKQDLLTGAPGQVVGFDAGGTAVAVQGWSNPNLLRNWDFRNPVNGQGKSEYSTAGYTIDGWIATTAGGVGNAYVGIVPGVGIKLGINTHIRRSVEPRKIPDGQTVTFSALVEGILISGTEVWTGDYKILAEKNGWRAALNHSEGVAQIYHPSGNAEDILIAAKLEYGSQQTLAHQDADGNWVLNDPADYDLQYTLCSQYSPVNGRWFGFPFSNPNLLDNWYFIPPINQRGQASYTGGGYTIDRWRSYAGEPSVTLTADGVQLTAGDWGQPIVLDALAPAVYTCSVLLTGNKLITLTMDATEDVKKTERFVDQETGFAISFAYRWTTEAHLFYPNSNGATNKAVAAKLELGPRQTLAHQDADGNWVLNDPPPNKALELAKCQRYQLVLPSIIDSFGAVGVGSSWNTTSVQIDIPLLSTFYRAATVSLRGNWALRGAGTLIGIDLSKAAVTGTTMPHVFNLDITGLTNIVPNECYELCMVDNTAKLIIDANI